MATAHSPVLIVGAGPTGLVLALWLAKIGIRARIIDKSEKVESTSRALVLHARTLELYQQLGIAEEVAARGFRFPKINLWVNRRKRTGVDIGDMGRGMSPFPYVLIFPQDQHEQLLIEKLKELGVEVERRTELLSFEQSKEGVTATLRTPSGEVEQFETHYLAGCDGAHSKVREILKTGFVGSTYPDIFYVADIVGAGPVLNGELHVSLDEAEFLAVFPLKDTGHARLIGVIRESELKKKPTWEDVDPRLLREMKINIREVRWFSTYHVHHRVASRFQAGRVFLLGDAGHIHSPVGGQGMNTGIGDAVNLAWKLGEVIKNKMSAKILESYEVERIKFAHQLVKTTDQAFRFVSSAGPIARIVRTRVAPVFLSQIFQMKFARHMLFKFISQTQITYRDSAFNQGQSGNIHAGDRLAWIESAGNFSPLRSLSWQVHRYGGNLIKGEVCGIPILNFKWNDEMERRGFRQNVVYLIRPDGYIGLITEEIGDVRNYLESKI